MTEITPDFVHEADGWRLSACEVPHAQPHLTCMAFRIDAGGKSFVYAGDAGHCEALSNLAQDADVLLHWCYRGEGETVTPELDRLSPTPSETAAFAKAAGVKRLLLTHFRVHMDTEEGHVRAKKALAEGFGPAAGIVEDLDVYDI